ncbi:MAG: carboxy-S-adenosyl-L-methionine synthase CmoA [Gammaproteobacteria bacterium]|nr:carboxy-S-adenosyl-L-methionine synthase CmoA [Gammaproteobacteria bacterium]
MPSPEEPTTVSTSPSPRDRLFATPGQRVDFAFDKAVADVFPDMIRRSVPGYETVVAVTGLLAARHLETGGRCYDLGCSLGASTLAVLRALGTTRCEILAVDSSAAMLDEARRRPEFDDRVAWVEADVREVEVDRAQVVILNYVLQFLPPEDRLPLLRRIRAGLESGGLLIVSEKLAAGEYFDGLHLDFKRTNGYSELEISQKRAALENVMRIDTEDTHLARFRTAGYRTARVWFRCLNWASFVAWPDGDPR